jgi:hypothetical protein
MKYRSVAALFVILSVSSLPACTLFGVETTKNETTTASDNSEKVEELKDRVAELEERVKELETKLEDRW